MNEQAQQIFDAIAAFCPVSAKPGEVITVIVNPEPVGKFFDVVDGKVTKKAKAFVTDALAMVFNVPDHETLKRLLAIVSESPTACVANCGWKPVVVGEMFRMVSSKRLEAAMLDPDGVHEIDGIKTFARRHFHALPSVWQIADRDIDQFTPPAAAGLDFDAWRAAMDAILPAFSATKALRAHSSSARVTHDGKPVGGGNGHTWFKLGKPEDMGTVQQAIIPRAVESSSAWLKPKHSRTTGKVIGQAWTTICDPSVFTLGHLIFVGRPSVDPLSGLLIEAQRFELLPGADTLDMAGVVVDTVKTLRQSLKHTDAAGKPMAPMVVKKSGSGVFQIGDGLTLSTELEIAGGAVVNVAHALTLINEKTPKIRCQAPFRESSSMAAFVAIDSAGVPFVWDQGTLTKYPVVEAPGKHSAEVEKIAFTLTEMLKAAVKPIFHELIPFAIKRRNLDVALRRCFWSADKGKVVALDQKRNSLSNFTEAHARNFALKALFGKLLDMDLLYAFFKDREDGKEEAEDLAKGAWSPLVNHLVAHRQVRKLIMTVDMFASSPSASFDADGVVNVTLCHQPFDEQHHIPQSDVDRVLADYRQHFPGFDGLIDMILYSRFIASTRRESFFYLRAGSSWGKAQLCEGVFGRLGILQTLTIANIEQALRGEPSPVDPMDFLRCWILHVDEWKKVSADLKLLTTSISISAKFAMRTEVPLFVKFFTNKEIPEGLSGGGAEAQFNNRFSYVDAGDAQIKDRALFQELGDTYYSQCLVAHVARYFNSGVAIMRRLGAERADRESREWVSAFRNKHLLSDTFGDFETSIEEHAHSLREMIHTWGRYRFDPHDRRTPRGVADALLASPMGWYRKDKTAAPLFVVVPTLKVVDEYIKAVSTGAMAGKIGYRRTDIRGALCEVGNKELRVNISTQKDGDTTRERGPGVFIMEDPMTSFPAVPPK
jgi:hypothetical protein